MTPRRLAVALLALPLLGAIPARADEPAPAPPVPAAAPAVPAPGDEARVAAAYLEGLNLRLRAKADEARLYEALGEKAKALAALREIGVLQKEGEAVVQRLLAFQALPAPTSRSPAPATPTPAPREDPERAAV